MICCCYESNSIAIACICNLNLTPITQYMYDYSNQLLNILMGAYTHIIIVMKFIHLAWTESHIGTNNSENLVFTDNVDVVHTPVQVQEGML